MFGSVDETGRTLVLPRSRSCRIPSRPGLATTVGFVHQHFLHLIKEVLVPGTAILFTHSRHHLFQHRERPTPFVYLVGREPIAAFRLDPVSLPNVVERN